MALPDIDEKIIEDLNNLNIHDNNVCNEVLQRIENLKLSDGSCENTVYYTSYCKLAAQLCYENNLRSDMLYCLSESHAAALRQSCHRQHGLFSNRNQSKFNDEHTSFRSSYANTKFEGLCRRIEELPKEWTVVQITQQFHTGEAWELRKSGTVVNETGLHIVRYSCGTRTEPVHVYIPPLKNELVNESILDTIHNSVLDRSLHTKANKLKSIKNIRLNSCSRLKEVTRDIANIWLKEWRCLLLGKIYDKTIEDEIRNVIENVLPIGRTEMTESDKLLIHQIANGCGLLHQLEVENALNLFVKDKELKSRIVKEIMKINSRFDYKLYYIKRYPVILLIDEKLQCVPWEETVGLRSQAISRIPSVHFVHALYKMHENNLVDGNVVIDRNVSGYYFINPDQTLRNTEKQMIDFLKKRTPSWHGTVGETTSKEELTKALLNYDIFLYCGHGSGMQYLKSSQLFTSNVKAIPLLYGCGSVEYKDQGGRVPYTSYANAYLIAGSPCVLGMLWPVTSTDTDNMALALLNYWLPGKPVVIDGMDKFDKDHIQSANTESELLRAVRFSRSVASFSFNRCAMIVHGLPVILK